MQRQHQLLLPSQQKNKMRAFAFYLLLSFLFIQINCHKKKTNLDIDINECDTIGNYYENGEHYIRRDLFNDDGVIDYNKMLDSYKGRNTACNPLDLKLELERK